MDTEDRKPLILLVDDEAPLRRMLTILLTQSGFNVQAEGTGEAGLASFDSARPDLVLLDVGLPDIDGWKVLEEIRSRGKTPVVMLTAHGTEPNRVRGLKWGADDYIVKPFSNNELIARLEAVLRRAVPDTTQDIIADGPLMLSRAERTAMLDGETLKLSAIEWKLLLALAGHPGSIISITTLLDQVWHDTSGVGRERVKFAVLRLRREFTDAGYPDPIRTVRGLGYQWAGFETTTVGAGTDQTTSQA